MNNPKISVIVPVYNVERYLRKCLDSIIAQTFSDWECICVDDGSPDNSGKILDEYAAKDKRFVIIHKENGGVSSARNAGLDMARGEYITFCDSDDWIDPATYYTAYMQAKAKHADIVQWDYDRIGTSQLFYDHQSLPENFSITSNAEFPWYFGMCFLRLYRNEIFIKYHLRFPRGIAWGEDTYISYLSLALAEKVIFIEHKFYHYFWNESSAVLTLNSQKLSDRVKVLKLMDEFCLNNKLMILNKIILKEKIATKFYFLLYYTPARYNDFLNTFPEVNNKWMYMTKKQKLIFFAIQHHLKIILDLFFYFYKKEKHINNFDE